jgi:hypothetical protein
MLKLTCWVLHRLSEPDPFDPRERERQRERQRETGRDRERQREKGRDRERERGVSGGPTVLADACAES